jgi:flagellar biosynthesis/type III secretory pathway protein FliH
VLHFTRVAPEIMVHLDGHVQQGETLTPAVMAETQGAADIVNEAHLRAEELRASAVNDLAEMRSEGYRVGHAEGYGDGIAAARATLAGELALVQAAGRAAKAARDSVVAAAERDIIELVIAAAQAVVGEQSHIDSQLVLQTLERAAQRLGSQNALRVRVSPTDASVVQAALGRREGTSAAWEVLPDGAIAVGGCIIETATGEVDARLDVQMDAVARVLRTAAPDVA